MQRFTDKVVFVTGASSGLGAAAALQFAREGARVFGIGRNGQGLAQLRENAADAAGAVHTAAVDISDPAQCRAAIAQCVERFGQLDVLVNAAGRHAFRHTATMSDADWFEDLAVNLNAPFFLSQAAIPHLLARQGNIVNVASIAAQQGQPYSAAYCSAKHGLLGLTRALAMEYMRTELRVNAICPGGMDTPQVRDIQIPPDADFELVMRSAGLRGMMSAEEVAAVILFLASHEARAIHGSVYLVDAGKTVG